ncbi:MAG: ClpX C4-type zinc finger protein, partial [Christensenella sp.]
MAEKTTDNNSNLKCTFCGKPQATVAHLIIGPGVNICNECIVLCNTLLESNMDLSIKNEIVNSLDFTNVQTPSEIKEQLDKSIVGQDLAKKTLAVTVYNHYKRILSAASMQKANVLLVGSVGVGKYSLVYALSKILEVPFTMVNTAAISEIGHRGDDIGDMLLNLIRCSDFSIERAENGIVYIDQIDELAKCNNSKSCQFTLAKLLSGCICDVVLPPNAGRANSEVVSIDTKNILFVLGGEFSNSDIDGAYHIKPHDLELAGLIHELIINIPIMAALKPLDENDLVDILKMSESNIIMQYEALFKLDNVTLEITEDALREIAKKALLLKMGASGLHRVVAELLSNIMYDIPTDFTIIKVTVDADSVISGIPKLAFGAIRKRY